MVSQEKWTNQTKPTGLPAVENHACVLLCSVRVASTERELAEVAEAPVAHQVGSAVFARWNLVALCKCCVLVHLACVAAEQCSWPSSVCSWPAECAMPRRSGGGAPRSTSRRRRAPSCGSCCGMFSFRDNTCAGVNDRLRGRRDAPGRVIRSQTTGAGRAPSRRFL